MQENRAHVKSLFKTTSFLGRQALPLRGHNERDEAENKGHFLELLDVIATDDRNVKSKQERRYAHYSSSEAQNDMVRIIGEKIRNIISEVGEARYFSVLVDETKDLSKKKQLAILIRYVHVGIIKEIAIGTYHMKDLTAESLAQQIIKELSSLDIQLCVAQCYDGARVMRGNVRGVQAVKREKCRMHTLSCT